MAKKRKPEIGDVVVKIAWKGKGTSEEDDVLLIGRVVAIQEKPWGIEIDFNRIKTKEKKMEGIGKFLYTVRNENEIRPLRPEEEDYYWLWELRDS